jgi:DNA-binding LacI/PurR family transcriptional regulator
VQLDDRSAGEAAARQLADRGCRRIVFVGRLDIDSSRDRFAGIQAVCEAAKLELRAVESHLNYQAGLEAGRRLADEEPADTGLIAMNDWLALGLRGGLDARGAHPVYPLVSFDGLDVAANPHLNIVSLRVPVELIASDTVAELRRLHGSPTSSGRTLTYELESPAYSPSLSI